MSQIAQLLLTILNYAVRGMTVIIGVLLLAYPFKIPDDNILVVRIFGGVVIAFGIVRSVLYHRNRIKSLNDQAEF